MGRLCETALRRPSAGSRLRRALHAPHRDRQSASRRHRRRAGARSATKTTARRTRPPRPMTLVGDRISPPLSAPRAAAAAFTAFATTASSGTGTGAEKLARCRQLLGTASPDGSDLATVVDRLSRAVRDAHGTLLAHLSPLSRRPHARHRAPRRRCPTVHAFSIRRDAHPRPAVLTGADLVPWDWCASDRVGPITDGSRPRLRIRRSRQPT